MNRIGGSCVICRFRQQLARTLCKGARNLLLFCFVVQLIGVVYLAHSDTHMHEITIIVEETIQKSEVISGLKYHRIDLSAMCAPQSCHKSTSTHAHLKALARVGHLKNS